MSRPHNQPWLGSNPPRETTIIIAGSVPAILALPRAVGESVPAVLLLHGFGADKHEVGGMYDGLAAWLAAHGIGSLRIDFSGSGDSPAAFADLTVQNQIEDALKALDYLRSYRGVDSRRLGVLGFSLGAAIAILVATQRAAEVRSLALWSPVGDIEVDLRESLDAECFEEAKQNGQVSVDLGFRTVTLKQPFFESLHGYDLEAQVATFPGSIFIAYGGRDQLSAYGERYLRAARGDLAELVLVPESDHVFRVLTDEKRDVLAVIDATGSWFGRTLGRRRFGERHVDGLV